MIVWYTFLCMKEVARQLRALGNERRFKIITLLMRSRLTVGEIARGIKLSFRSTSRHLQILKHAGLVESEQVGLSVFYRVVKDNPVFRALCNHMTDR